MKKIYAIGLVIFVSLINAELEPLPPSLLRNIRKLQAYCQRQTNVSEELVSQSRRNVFSNDRALQCFLQCILDISGMMNSDNEITLEPLKIFFPESWFEVLTNIQNTCGAQGGADACEIAYNTFICFAHELNEQPLVL